MNQLLSKFVRCFDQSRDERSKVVVSALRLRLGLLLIALCGLGIHVDAAEPSEMFELWPRGTAPGVSRVQADLDESLVTDRRRTFDQLTNISIPRVAVFLAPQGQRTGAAILVCPGIPCVLAISSLVARWEKSTRQQKVSTQQISDRLARSTFRSSEAKARS